MANFALILPRPEMVAQAGRIARQLGMKVVLNQYAVTEQILDVAADARKLGADIVVARGYMPPSSGKRRTFRLRRSG